MTPLSTAIRMRGKLVAGKTETGIVKARYTPNSATVRIRKITDLEWRANQYEGSGSFAVILRSPEVSATLFLIGAFHFDLRVIGQAVRSGGNYFIPGIQSFSDLNLLVLANADAHIGLVRVIISPHQHY